MARGTVPLCAHVLCIAVLVQAITISVRQGLLVEQKCRGSLLAINVAIDFKTKLDRPCFCSGRSNDISCTCVCAHVWNGTGRKGTNDCTA